MTEQEILKFWQENKIFEKSVEKPAGKKPKGDFVFYDGPPFATGTPHYGHIVASVIKDAVPRYWTMKGYRVERRWGWDCHGLPIENIAEKELGIKRKKEIEEMGIGKFNEFCRSKIFNYADEWKKVIGRLGRWADMENSYKTMDISFMESVWWVFRQLWDKGLIYEGYRPMHICARCETTLSQQEVSEGYKNIKDISATVKFELVDEPDVFVLAWTTTPWTLIGNAALAINNEIIYCKIKSQKSNLKNTNQNLKLKEGEFYILAKERLGIIKDKYEIIKEFKGKDLIGKKYKPFFDYYYNDKNLKNRENGWKIYAGDFVQTDEGTGVVHIAPAFGEDDFKMMEKYKLPFIQHIGMNGIIKPEAKNFSGMSVKPIDNHQKTDIEIIKNLAGRGLLFAKEKYEHSYPHCWRCDTPLVNYAASSWFVNILKIKKKTVELAKGINWSPAHIKEGRFGKWLEGARDWSISRQRYWASVLPIWKCDKCGNAKVVGSVEEIKKYTKKSGNKYFLMRHGEAESNVKNIVASKIETAEKFSLTEKGKKQILSAVKKIKKNKIDAIFSSDFLRAKETAEIMAGQFDMDKSKIIYDKRLREVNTGIFDGKKPKEYHDYFSSLEEKFYKNPPKGENLTELKNRVAEFIYEIENKYNNKNILIISHEYPIWLMFGAAIGADVKKSAIIKQKKGDDFIKTAEILELYFVSLPHNTDYELDLHRPYIDKIEFNCECGSKMKRVPDVLDTWFDSGSMPYAQAHYPFENKEKFEKNFPAQFIAEGVDQTRAWFYYLHSIAAAVKNSRAFDNVIVNGTVLAEDGKKMSKRLKNYPDPMEIINKYGADSLRFYLLSSPVVMAENLNFSEKGVDEAHKKVLMRLKNVLAFYEMYGQKIKNQKSPPKADPPLAEKIKITNQNSNVLDKWIIIRLNQLIKEVSEAMDKYELNEVIRPIADFIDDLSTWYIRRSRERFKEKNKDGRNAIAVTRHVLSELSKIIAPFTPFIAEEIYQSLNNESRSMNYESVHLEEWPKFEARSKKQEARILKEMVEARKICSLGLEARQKAQIKVRQPLAELRIKNYQLKNKDEFLGLIKDELNVKEIVFDKNIAANVELNTEITPELKAEGESRELVRIIQDLRKEAGLMPKNEIVLYVLVGDYLKNLISKNMDNLKKEVGAKIIEFMKTEKIDAGEETKIDDSKIWIGVRKI